MARSAADEHTEGKRRHPRGAVRDGLVAAGLELARAGGPDAVVLREATRIVGVVPNADNAGRLPEHHRVGASDAGQLEPGGDEAVADRAPRAMVVALLVLVPR